MYFASLRYTSPTFVASMVNTIASLTFVMAVVLRWDCLLTSKILVFLISIYLWLFASRYVLIFIQDRGSWSSKSSWDGKSSWNFDLLSWCNDNDIIQGTYHEKSMAPCNPYSRKYCHTWELVKGFYSNYCKLHNLVYMVHHAGFAPT